MAESTRTDQTPVTTTAGTNGNSFIKRELNGASFLTLEHVAHMALVVIVAGLLATGIGSALSMWMGGSSVFGGASAFGSMGTIASGLKSFEATMALGLVATLLILVPLMIVLDRRTRAEWGKRPGYAGRLAYKVPVYGALGLLTVGKVLADISMLTVIISSLVLIGVPGTDFGAMYLHQFLPAFLAAVVFAGAWWYVFKLAKGNDMGKSYSAAIGVLGLAVAVALVITSAVILHSKDSTDTLLPGGTDYFNDYNDYESSDSLEDIFKY